MYFRTDTYLGFYVAELEQVPMGYLFTYSFFVFLLFYISLSFCTEAFAADLREIASDVNLKFSHKKPVRNSSEAERLIKNFVDLHNDMIGYFILIKLFQYFFSFFSFYQKLHILSQLLFFLLMQFQNSTN